MKNLPVGIEENLQFLCVEVNSQVSALERYFLLPSPGLARRLRDRAGYAYNLRARIHSAIANFLADGIKSDLDKFFLRSIYIVATELEWIAEVCRKCIDQTEQLDNTELLMSKPFIAILKKVRQAIKIVPQATLKRQSDKAVELEQIHQRIKLMHERLMKRYLDELKKHRQTKQVSLAMFVAYELKQMDAAIVDMSEAIISSSVGQSVSFERYSSLQSLIDDVDVTDEGIEITPIAETRSGSAISGVTKVDDDELIGIYKDGETRKLKEEKDGVDSWHDIYPGLAPKILSYHKNGETASLLIEHLPGYTFEKIIIGEEQKLIKKALKHLAKTLRSVWKETRTKKIYPAKYMQQMQKRMPEVYKIHPEFALNKSTVCGVSVASMDQLIEQAMLMEQSYPPPFSVYIHGDFNVDNIIYDPLEKQIKFIDLHRSQYMDYVQDVSIFMVSNYRLQIADRHKRQQIMSAAIVMYEFAKRFAKKQKDDTFELRLALGLARGFATSTRFILDKSLAKRMFLRSRYLLELVNAVPVEQAPQFLIPIKEIFVE